MGERCDVVVVGGGHNGLVCACYLAARGLAVTVLERRAVVGGAAVTEEFHPGFRNSTASYTVSLLHPKVIRDLRLAEHGLRIVERPYSNFLPLPDGQSLRVGGGVEATQREIARFSRRDADQLPLYYARLEAVAEELGGEAEPCDVSDRAAVESVAARVLDRHPRIDLLVNNAGIPGRTRFLDGDPEVIERLMRINYLGSVWCTRAFLPGLERLAGITGGLAFDAFWRRVTPAAQD